MGAAAATARERLNARCSPTGSPLLTRLAQFGSRQVRQGTGRPTAIVEREAAGRFGRDAIVAHRLARGSSQRPPLRRALPRR